MFRPFYYCNSAAKRARQEDAVRCTVAGLRVPASRAGMPRKTYAKASLLSAAADDNNTREDDSAPSSLAPQTPGADGSTADGDSSSVDTVVLSNLDHLVSVPTPAFAYRYKCYPTLELNSGVMVLSPSEGAHARMLAYVRRTFARGNESRFIASDASDQSVWRQAAPSRTQRQPPHRGGGATRAL